MLSSCSLLIKNAVKMIPLGDSVKESSSSEEQKNVRITRETFLEETSRLEIHQYTAAQVAYKSSFDDSSSFFPNGSGKISFTYDAENKIWQPVEESTDLFTILCTAYLGLDIHNIFLKDYEDEEVSYTYNFYKNPYKIVYNQKGTRISDSSTNKINDTATMVLDKYGWFIDMNFKYDETTTNYNSEDSSIITESTLKGTFSLKISYK